MSTFYSGDEICIVGSGCVLPDASSVQSFWENVKTGHCSIIDLFESGVLDKELYLDTTKTVDSKTYSAMAGCVQDDRITSSSNKAHAMLTEASKQAIACLSTKDFSDKKIDIYIGSCEGDQNLSSELFIDNNEEVIATYFKEHHKTVTLDHVRKELGLQSYSEEDIASVKLNSSILEVVKKEFGIKAGKRAIVDAACASSLAAIDISIKVLQNNEADMVITGGVDSNLGVEAFVMFSAPRALSSKKCAPFDSSADGISLGEGCAVFVLQKLKNAIRDNNTIYGIIKSMGSSSDGNASSIFSPSLSGQKLCLERAYTQTDIEALAYIECHGTGTKLGDKTEISSLQAFFSERKKRLPIGSVKALTGHTRAAAGSVGLLKALCILDNGVIPPSRYLQKSIEEENGKVFVNQKEIILDGSQDCVGVSSFGFGNINYHMIVEKFFQEKVIQDFLTTNKEKSHKNIVVIGESLACIEEIDKDYVCNRFKILPTMFDQADSMQILSLLAVEKAVKNYNILLRGNEDDVKVLSGSCTGLDLLNNSGYRIKAHELGKVKGVSKEDVKNIQDLLAKKYGITSIREDMSFGQLNNVLADRVSNFFNFRGKNCNIDSDFNSLSLAIDTALREIVFEEGVVIVVSPYENFSKNMTLINRGKMRCYIFSSLEYAKSHNYPILFENVSSTYKSSSQ